MVACCWQHAIPLAGVELLGTRLFRSGGNRRGDPGQQRVRITVRLRFTV